ncbi:MAG: EAL domain-containing protein [Cellulomonadaceae bacterium]|nr:EAL domain-containing protein [Cellulomonadaceae bacterium]
MSSGGGSPATRAPDDAPLDALIESGGLSCVYEPLVDLHSGAVLGHEALLRGPMGTPWRSPLVLLAAARHADRLVELETHSLCTSLLDAARAAGSPPLTLFVNVEPATLARGLPTIITLLEGRARHVQVVVEITERALAEDPDAMMTAADRLRAVGCAIALDDVGAEPASLALMPMLSPEVVKLDLQLLRTVTDPETILVSASVRDFAAATGAEVVAEGVETTADLTRAHALGATIGQGWWWSRELHELGGSTHRPERFRARLPAGIPRLSPRRASLHAAPAVPTQPEASQIEKADKDYLAAIADYQKEWDALVPLAERTGVAVGLPPAVMPSCP